MQVLLPQFEGPMGLLLYLIKKDELDIYNIPIHNITQQYFEHLKKMKELDLEVAGDFIAMAATLIFIKSRMLLPQYDENGEVIEESEDPRKELVQKLLEYQKFQEASKTLNERSLLGRDVWARGLSEELPIDEGDIIVDEGGLFSLISMYRKVVRQLAKSVHNVRAKGQSIAARVLEIRDRLVVGRRVVMSDLIHAGETGATKVLITFLSLLELTKMGFTNIFQSETYGEIYVDTLKVIERDVIERVEEYDQKPEQAAALAAALEVRATENQAQESTSENLELDMDSEEPVQMTLSEISESEEEVVAEDFATNDEILAAERELGFESSDEDLKLADAVTTEISLEQAPLESVVAPAEEISIETTEVLPESVVIEQPPLIIEEQDFEDAWAKFEDDAHGIAIDKEAQIIAQEQAVESQPAIQEVVTEEADDFAVADIHHIFKKTHEPESEI